MSWRGETCVDALNISPGTNVISWILVGILKLIVRACILGLPDSRAWSPGWFSSLFLWEKTLINETQMRFCVLELSCSSLLSCSNDYIFFNRTGPWQITAAQFSWGIQYFSLYVPLETPLGKEPNHHLEMCTVWSLQWLHAGFSIRFTSVYNYSQWSWTQSSRAWLMEKFEVW